MAPRRVRPAALAVALALGAAAACEGEPAPSHGGALFPALTLTSVAPALVVPGSRLRVRGGGFLPAAVASHEIALVGAVAGAPIDLALPASFIDEQTLEVAVGDGLLAELTGASGAFVGRLDARRQVGGRVDVASLAVDLGVTTELAPSFTGLSHSDLYPGDRVVVTGAGLLLPTEGLSLLRLDGRFTAEATGAETVVSGLLVPLTPSPDALRGEATLTLTPDLFGVVPGTFEGSARIVNVGLDGVERASAAKALPALRLRAPVITHVTPERACRGQRVHFHGRGLLPPDGPLQVATVLVLEGVFTPRRGVPIAYQGVDALTLYPDTHLGNVELSVTLRVVLGEDGGLEGLGATAGVFEGRVTPLILAGPDAVEGAPLPVTLAIANPRQIVHIRYLPSFAEATAEFGLMAEREAIKARIMAVCERDFEGVNISFTAAEPADFAEFAVVEVGGHDPNGSGLFGLDNTAGKDVGNLRFDDVIGGFNAETRARSFAAYGGIFTAELLSLSPTLSDAALASPRFDDVFAPVAPALGGTPALAGEADGDDARGAAIREAVRVLGNLVGTTITHEVGHTLGLTAIDGRVHNEGDNVGWIMDAGIFRPFEERAELDGAGPAVFSPFNRAYLTQTLPLDPEGTLE
ncbi:MAG: hypothetical protein CSA66_02460 [Proteobacteria bacterium]|nr:MAG: hypothetical protein CSA66_02460 [Pseudomonadota bacterium]